MSQQTNELAEGSEIGIALFTYFSSHARIFLLCKRGLWNHHHRCNSFKLPKFLYNMGVQGGSERVKWTFVAELGALLYAFSLQKSHRVVKDKPLAALRSFTMCHVLPR